jgi:hypothetical protein
MGPPIGFVTLYNAVEAVGRALFGSSWQHASPLNREADKDCDDAYERVITMIAEGCEAGHIAAGYRTVTGGVDNLDLAVWLSPAWRNYFVTGTIDIDLPLVDERLRPVSDGRTARCSREIFVRRDSLDRFIKTLAPAVDENQKRPLRQASKEEIRVEIRAVYNESGKPPPNIKQLPKVVQPRLHNRGLDASENYIAKVGNESEFVSFRRPAGRTIASQRHQ